MISCNERRTVLFSFYFAPMHTGVSCTPWQLLELADLQGEALMSQCLQRKVARTAFTALAVV